MSKKRCDCLHLPYVFLKFVFWQHLPVGSAGCTDFGCFWQTSLCTNFGQQFFSGPRYIVKPQLPAGGRTSKKHTLYLLDHRHLMSLIRP